MRRIVLAAGAALPSASVSDNVYSTDEGSRLLPDVAHQARRGLIGAWARAHGHPEVWDGPVPEPEGDAVDDKPKSSFGLEDEDGEGDEGENGDVMRFEPERVDVDPDEVAVEG